MKTRLCLLTGVFATTCCSFAFAQEAAISGVAKPAAPLQTLTHHVREGQAQLVGHLPADQFMRIVLVLPNRNQAQLDQLLDDLYNPDSPSYRNFLTLEEFTSRFGPTQEDYEALVRFA